MEEVGDMNEILYRKADMADIDKIFCLVENAVRQMERNGIDQWDEIYPAKEDFIADVRKNELYIGEFHNEIAVVYALNKECDAQYRNGEWRYSGKDYCVIHRLCVAAVCQNKGIARMTLRYIENQLKCRGIKAVRLDVFSKNPYALKLYADSGYIQVGTADWRKGRFFLMEKLI